MTRYQYEQLIGHLARIEALLERLVEEATAPMPSPEEIIAMAASASKANAIQVAEELDARREVQQQLRSMPVKPVA